MITPEGNSRVKTDLKYILVRRQGFSGVIVFITRFWLSRNKTSIGKRIKKEWIQWEGAKIRASPFFKELRLSKPTRRVKEVLAIFASSARRVSLVTLIIFI